MIHIPRKVIPEIHKKIVANYSLNQNKDKLSKKFDLFICNSGYEPRTYGFIKASNSIFKSNNSIVFLFHPKESNLYLKNLKNLKIIKKYLKNICPKIQIIEIDPTNPWSFRKKLLELLKENKISQSNQVLVDITSFTRVFLYELLHSLYKVNCNFSLSYTEPKDYVKTLPTGVNKIIISPSFVGKPRLNKKAFLLLFFGWETDRTRDTFENYNSNEHLGVFGVAPIDKKHIRWQMESYTRNKDLMRKMKDVDTCSTIDLDDILKWLYKIYYEKQEEFKKRNEKFYFAISGSGPKIQNIAACFLAMKFKDIQLVYGTPSYWGPAKTKSEKQPIESTGIGRTYIYGPYSKKILDRFDDY